MPHLNGCHSSQVKASLLDTRSTLTTGLPGQPTLVRLPRCRLPSLGSISTCCQNRLAAAEAAETAHATQ